MARGENCPVPRGETWYGPTQTIDSNDLGGANLEGTEWEWDDILVNPTGGLGARSYRSPHKVVTLLVRNMSAGTLYAGQLASFRVSGLNILGQVDGLVDTTAEFPCAPVDEYLGSGGVRQYDLCHVVIRGPAMCHTDLAGAGNNVIAVGDVLVALTAATSAATTAGRVKPQDLSGATAVLGGEINGAIGRALSAKTTTQTNGDVLVNMTVIW